MPRGIQTSVPVFGWGLNAMIAVRESPTWLDLLVLFSPALFYIKYMKCKWNWVSTGIEVWGVGDFLHEGYI